ncbi:Uncharacterised protein [Mycobacteroides abscessus subsp. abscessus]|nr:Uncharacterised protein [Mycobacteroides abscessus subsp. abscessus]
MAANTIAATTPANMPTPPSLGVGMVCTSRTRGTATAPTRIAITRTSDVSRYVMAAAVRPTNSNSRSGTPAPPELESADSMSATTMLVPVTGSSIS